MADIRCSNCGKDNPDFFDVCQFCQTPLKPESMVHIGENPVKKNTGELEPILPQWLKDVRQQARESAAEDAAEEAAKPKVQKNEAPDLLAGLASQSRSDDDDIPDWLAGISPAGKSKPAESAPAEPANDFFAQFNKPSEPEPVKEPEPAQEEIRSWTPSTAETPQAAEEVDELSDWFAKASEEPSAPVEMESVSPDWMGQSDAPAFSFKEAEPTPPQKEEDLGWLHALEDSTKDAAQPPAQEQAPSELPSIPSDGGDLSWLNQLGGSAVTPEQPEQAVAPTPSNDLSWLDKLGGAQVDTPQSNESQATAPQEELGWLNNLGGTEIAAPQTNEAQAATPQNELSWLDNLGGEKIDTPQSNESQAAAPQEDLSWLNSLGSAAEPAQQESASAATTPDANNLDWLNNLGGQSVQPFREKPSTGELDWMKNFEAAAQQGDETPIVSPFVPRRTAPLEDDKNAPMPDWLKDATEEPSMPAPGALSEWFAQSNTDAARPSTPQPASPEPTFSNAPSDSQSMSNQDIDSLLSSDMPDWLSQPEQGATDASSAFPTNDSLTPADLPSWVQSMKPVDSVIAQPVNVDDRSAEREGPLAGLSGVIPIAPIGSSRRPKAISLKLQASDEQQAGAELLERILSSETNPKPLTKQTKVTTPLVLRWVLTILFLVVLSAMAYTRSTSMPVSPALPQEVVAASSIIGRLPQNSLVLVVVDYEPALAAEMEAVSGPMLDQLALVTHARLAFISTSPNGTALVRRLLTNTGISVPAPNGLGYVEGQHYINLGYLAGGYSGVRGFIESPLLIKPQAGVTEFKEYAAILVLTDHAESGRMWVEQLEARNSADTTFFAVQPLLFAASAQAGPLLKPYFSSEQITGMVSGLADAVQYEFINNSRPGIARRYWDSYGAGILIAVISIVFGSLWNFVSGIRARRANGEAG